VENFPAVADTADILNLKYAVAVIIFKKTDNGTAMALSVYPF
jgi:hypothetical protein